MSVTGLDPSRIVPSGGLFFGKNVTPVNYAFANPNASGITEVVPAQAGQSIVVLAFVVVTALAQSVEFLSANTAISANFPFASNGGVASPFSQHGWFSTNLGEALNINLSASSVTGVQVVWTPVI